MDIPLAQTYAYDSFGKQMSSSGSLTNPFQYTARELDPETSLYYYRARYYDSATARFLSEDPIGFNADGNFYRYALGSPLTYTDPMGLTVSCIYISCQDNCNALTMRTVSLLSTPLGILAEPKAGAHA
jgi:RHS repeat-associated protein